MSSLIQDLRFALRQLAARPGNPPDGGISRHHDCTPLTDEQRWEIVEYMKTL